MFEHLMRVVRLKSYKKAFAELPVSQTVIEKNMYSKNPQLIESRFSEESRGDEV